MSVFILMQEDTCIGVYSTLDKANAAMSEMEEHFVGVFDFKVIEHVVQ